MCVCVYVRVPVLMQAGSESAQAVSTALEAACCCLQVLAAPSMHSSLYMDEVMTATVNLAKYQLQYNVLALHDPQYKRLYRPAAAAQGEGVVVCKNAGSQYVLANPVPLQ